MPGKEMTQGYERFGNRLVSPGLRSKLFRRTPPDTVHKVYVDNQPLVSDEVLICPVHPNNRVVSSKYTLLNFLPKNLFEQFRRIANFYFLCVGIVQFLIDTPVTPLTSILPLVFVISVTAVKQGYEDWLRHRADNEVNLRSACVVRQGQLLTDCKAMDIKVGDIVKVHANEEFPCDLVMLSSSDLQGTCYITTANLDGETNLKTHYCLSETRKLGSPDELGSLRARITCKPPVADLYTFEGVMDITAEGTPKPLGPDHLLLRGARLKNTDYIYGCAVYTGNRTKMALNSKFKQTKFSRIERKMNLFLVVFLVTLLVEAGVCTYLKYWFEDANGDLVYVPTENIKNKGLKVVENFLSFMVLFNYIIPISLYVTIEMQKFIGSLFFGWDVEMYDQSIDACAQANTSDLNEELGQVEYLFTDKTGTLTENQMEFRQCLIGARQFEEVGGTLCERVHPMLQPTPCTEFSTDMDEFIQVLVLCHTVRVDRMLPDSCAELSAASSVYSSSGEEYDYQASSPDEKALVKACCRFGVVYHGIQDDCMEVSFRGQMKRFKLLHTLPFDPVRKRMSIIVEDEKGDIYLLCKGAEVAILDRVRAGDTTTTERMINQYAVLGLRTLTIAHRRLTEEEFKVCDVLLSEAKTSLTRRDQMLAAAYNEIEQGLTLLGATAVEDKLQDQVPETIEALRTAGIKVWVLTGDKEETAVNISHSAGHFNAGMIELRLTQVASHEQCREQLQHMLNVTSLALARTEHALIIDGQTLTYALSQHRELLCKLCLRCVAVLCCRMSPIQKAEVVSVIKLSPGKPVTAAIGDGANDVSMIQEADVGLGIMGKEGRQAVRTSDYAFGKFKFLQRVILVHGHLYYSRLAILVQYFFYKNIAWITPQVYYAIFSAFSQQTLYDPFILMFYNITFTSLPILMYGLFEQQRPQDVLLRNPRLYRKVSKNALMSWREFIKWNALGLWHSCVFYFGMMFLRWGDVSMYPDGLMVGYASFGCLVYFTCVVAVNCKLLLETYFWSVPLLVAYTLTSMAVIFMPMIYVNFWWPSWMVDGHDMYKVLGQLLSSAAPWLAMILLIILALLPDILLRMRRDIQGVLEMKRSTAPTLLQSSSSEFIPGSQHPQTNSMTSSLIQPLSSFSAAGKLHSSPSPANGCACSGPGHSTQGRQTIEERELYSGVNSLERNAKSYAHQNGEGACSNVEDAQVAVDAHQVVPVFHADHLGRVVGSNPMHSKTTSNTTSKDGDDFSTSIDKTVDSNPNELVTEEVVSQQTGSLPSPNSTMHWQASPSGIGTQPQGGEALSLPSLHQSSIPDSVEFLAPTNPDSSYPEPCSQAADKSSPQVTAPAASQATESSPTPKLGANKDNLSNEAVPTATSKGHHEERSAPEAGCGHGHVNAGFVMEVSHL